MAGNGWMRTAGAESYDPQASETAWLYLRKSRDEEHDPEILSKHHAELTRLIAADGRAVPQANIYAEIGSGETIASRTVFQRLLSLWERLPENHGGVVYVTELPRLSRGNQAEQGRVQDALARANILIRDRGRTYDLRNEDDAFTFEAIGLVGRQELRFIKRRLKAGRRETIRKGRAITGAAPFGYVWDKLAENWQAHPTRFSILVSLCREIHTHSTRALGEKYAIPKNCVLRTLSNPAICGWPAMRFGKRALPKEQWLWAEEQNHSYPHACTREEWDAIQAVLEARATRGAKTGGLDGWCRDVVRFEGAGASTRVHLSNINSNKPWGYLTYQANGPERGRLYVAREIVHTAVREFVLSVCRHPQILRHVAALYERLREEIAEGRKLLPDAQAFDREIEAIEQTLDDLLLRESQAVGDEEEQASIRRVRERQKVRLKELKSARRAAQVAGRADPHLEQMLEAVPLFVEAGGEVWEELTESERRIVVNGFVEAVVVRISGQGRPGRNGAFIREVVNIQPRPWLVPVIEALQDASSTGLPFSKDGSINEALREIEVRLLAA